MKPATLHRRACGLLGVAPEKVPLLGPAAFRAVTGHRAGGYGTASRDRNVIYVKRTAGYDSYIHELLHLLFPSRPHWWVYSAAYKLTGTVHGRPAKQYGYQIYGQVMSADRCKESRTKLLTLARKAAVRRGLATEP